MPSFILLNTKAVIMNVDDLPDNSERILQFIQQNPGLHLRQIKRELNLSMGTIQYHLNLLEKNGKIFSDKHTLQRHYFPVGTFGIIERNLLKVLNQETTRDILMFIVEQKNPTQTNIVDYINISAPSVNWHLNNLLNLGIIKESRDGKFKRYALVGSADFIISLMKNYHASIWDKWSTRLAEMFLSLREEEKSDDR